MWHAGVSRVSLARACCVKYEASARIKNAFMRVKYENEIEEKLSA
jgi:hypothetical protein